ncbi:hypothetical protein BC831DRAFT_431719 [Entophlyctis helioformis]|nr:hypothetical protein BC831DRAFT_431719 [Entophlyctis helioformis]
MSTNDETQLKDDDTVDVFGTGWSMLFNLPEINIGEPGAVIDVRLPGLASAIKLHIADVDAKNTGLFAHHLWKASILVSRLLVKDNRSGGMFDVVGKSVLELGAGAGLPSIVCALLGAQLVVSSDYPDDHLIKTLDKNLSANLAGKLLDGQSVHAVPHIWGEPVDNMLVPAAGFDRIILADTFWMGHQHDNLLKDLVAMLAPTGSVIAAAGLHSGRMTMEKFFIRAKEDYGFVVERIMIVNVPVGSGVGEELTWETVDEADVVDTIEERSRFLFLFKLTKAQ